MRIATIAAAAVIAAPVAAYAGPTVYGSLNVGGSTTSDVSSSIYAPSGAIFGEGPVVIPTGSAEVQPAALATPSGSDAITGSYDVKPAVAVSGSAGLDWGMFRTELELAYSQATVRGFHVDSLTSGGGNTTSFADACAYLSDTCPASGNFIPLAGVKLRQLSGMANAWVDSPVGGKIEPYLGGGVGFNDIRVNGQSKTKFAWQVGGGLAWWLQPKLALTADVRYRETDPITIDLGAGSGATFGRVKTVTYGAGLRYRF